MNSRPTPETDAFSVKFKSICGSKAWVPTDICRRFELERDEAREERDIARLETEEISQELANARKQIEGLNNFANERYEEIQKVRKERDEARKETEYYKERYEQLKDERDEAREEVDYYREKHDLTPMSWNV